MPPSPDDRAFTDSSPISRPFSEEEMDQIARGVLWYLQANEAFRAGTLQIPTMLDPAEPTTPPHPQTGRSLMDTTPETYQQRYHRLHEALNELLAAYAVTLRHRDQIRSLDGEHMERFLEGISAAELLEWSYRQMHLPPTAHEQIS